VYSPQDVHLAQNKNSTVFGTNKALYQAAAHEPAVIDLLFVS
jgi:hypothetical protein